MAQESYIYRFAMKKVSLILLTIFICSFFASAQKVGLVLSGGGAKGFAHIGVIRVLEENNIPIDYIAGTSIGAIVGALYAAGYSTDEMEELFKSESFYSWSTGKILEEYRYYFKKQEDDPGWLELSLKKKDDKLKILLPTNLIPVEQMDFAFMELLASTNAVSKNNFDSLFVPFRCVATDVYANREVVLKDGDLGEAVRASMTIPLYFKPIYINGTLLFDGGILNNFPTDVMKEAFHPDVIIGHKVVDEYKHPEPDDLLELITNIVMQPTNYKIDADDGILLETRLSNVGLFDFNKIESTLNAGIKTANTYIDSIKQLVQRRVPKEVVDKRRKEFNDKKPELLFQNFQVEGVSDPAQRRFIIQSIKHKSNIINLDNFRKEYYKLATDKQIQSLRPIAMYNYETGYFDVHLKITPQNKMEIKFGGNVSTSPINQGFLGFDYRIFKNRAYTFTSNIYFGRFYSSFKAGGRIDFPTKVPLYLAGYSTLNRWDFYSSSTELLFEDVKPPYIIQNEYNLRFEAGVPLGVSHKLSAGVAYSNSRDEYYQTKTFGKEDEPDKTDFNAFVLSLGVESNSLNYKQYATRGLSNGISAKYISGKENNLPGTTSSAVAGSSRNHSYFLFEAYSDKYYQLGRRVTLGTAFKGVYSNKNTFSNYTSTVLAAPGFTPTPHSKSIFIENFHANKYLAGGLKGIFNFNGQFHLRLEGFCFAPVKEILPDKHLVAGYSPLSFTGVHFQGMAALVYHTVPGPISFAVNYYDKPDAKFFMTLNFGYILFNKRGF
ncbi:putative patatin-like phospholipase [hydrothermal vent metagenome]|uniref:Putative patatin-like phospholipase n=1 Tax=hydrothermal vent metagenome TaxID=652676 RepID=A0A3B0TRQ3_9ZZZZ